MHISLPQKSDVDVVPTRPYWLVLIVLVLAELVAALESSMIYAALPKFYQLFNNPISVGWLLTAYMLVSAVATALCSRLGDLLGRRKVLLWVLGLAGVGSVISAVSTSVEGITLGRAIQGGAGAILPLCFGLARENVPSCRLAFTIGVISSAAGIGGGLGFLIGGLIVDLLVWQWLFWISAGLAALVFVIVLMSFPPSTPTLNPGKLDIWGGILFAPGIAAVLLAVSMGRTWGWVDARTIALFGSGILVLALWVWHELRQSNPLLNVRLLLNRQVALANFGFFMLAVGAMNVQVLTVLLQQPVWTGPGLGLSATMAGMVKFPSVFLAMIAGVWGGWLTSRRGGRSSMLVAAMLVSTAWISLLLNHGSFLMVMVMFLLSAFGSTLAFGAVANLVVEASPADRTSEATGLTQVIRSLGMAIGAQVLAVLMASSTVSDPSMGPGRFPDAQAYNLTISVVAIFSIVSLLAAWWLPRRKAGIAVAKPSLVASVTN